MRTFYIGVCLFGLSSALVVFGLVALMDGTFGITSALPLSWAVLTFGLAISYMVLYIKD